MPTEELKCIEVLLRHMILGTDLKREIDSEFINQENFHHVKDNLFNQIIIMTLLSNIHNKPNFSLEEYLTHGRLPGTNIEVQIPTYDSRFENRDFEFYQELFKALEEDNYVFDESSNILVSSEKLETLIPREWLYRLSKMYKKSSYQRVFLFNKNEENDIVDKNSLLTYLYHTKTFIVTLESPDQDVDFDAIFENAKQITSKLLAGRKEIKVDEIIDIFQSSLPKNVTATISKYKISDATWLIPYAEKNRDTFYSRPLEEQKDTLNKWMLSFIKSNATSLEETQKLLPVLNKDITDKHKKNSIIIGLFEVYMTLLHKMDIDFQSISLTPFKIDTYMSDDYQANLSRLHELVKKVNNYKQKKVLIDDTIESILTEIDSVSGPELTKLEGEYSACLSERTLTEATIDKLSEERKELMIANQNYSGVEEIAFDNDRIMSLMMEAIKEGRIFINPYNKNRLTIELHNDEIGKTTFQMSISLEKLLEFVENNNYGFDTYSINLR